MLWFMHFYCLFVGIKREIFFKKRKPKLTEGFMPGIPRGEEREARASEWESTMETPKRFIWRRRAPWSGRVQHPVPLCCSFVTPWGCDLFSAWSGFVIQWEAEPLVLGLLVLVKSLSSSWEVSFRKQQSHLPAKDPVALDKEPVSRD